MFALSGPWWELPARVTIIYLVLLVLVRVSGKRTVGQFTPFDLLVVMLLSESVSSGLSGREDSVTGGLLAAATLVGLNAVVAVLSARSMRMQTLVEGAPVLIGRDGRFFDQTLRKNHVPKMDVERALREADCDLKDMKYAFLEADGGISVLKSRRPRCGQEAAPVGEAELPRSRRALPLRHATLGAVALVGLGTRFAMC